MTENRSENRILAAMSGGVDSSVMALLLKNAGYAVSGAMLRMTEDVRAEDVSGAMLRMTEDVRAEDVSGNGGQQPGRSASTGSSDTWSAGSESSGSESSGSGSAGSGSAALQETSAAYSTYAAAADVCEKIGIPFEIIDVRDDFRRNVICDFVRSYENCLTPNPCVVCNRRVKFAKMLEAAAEMGIEKIASGHYASVESDPESGRYIIRKGADRAKDQSYVLWQLTQEQLSRIIMPLGKYTKTEIRRMASEAGFKNAEAPESQDICFIPDGDYASFVERFSEAAESANLDSGRTESESLDSGHPDSTSPEPSASDLAGPGLIPENPGHAPGNFIDKNGRILGRHKGLIHYTIGQRKGLGLSLPAPLYVCEKRPDTNEVVLCPNEELFVTQVRASSLNWVSVSEPSEPLRVSAKIRYSQNETNGTAVMTGADEVTVFFDSPVRAPAPGQSLVMYCDDMVAGGGIIC